MNLTTNSAPFPFTLTLSLGEREQQLSRCDFSKASLAVPALRWLKRLDTILRLPRGEGRGEGKARVDFSATVRLQEAFL
jgi:hypothetical protein